MLASLFISNYALIDTLHIDFDSGFNIITGETGSGKSIVLGALSLIMGDRADIRTIRIPERKTVVEAKFEIDKFVGFNELLSGLDIDTDQETCIIRRELTVRGTSRAFINDTPVNLTTLKEITERLLDIHTQHENRLLADSSFQLQVIDTVAKNEDLLKEYVKQYAEYKKILKEYIVFRDNLTKSKSEFEYNAYLLHQLEELNIQPGEQERLERERDMAANATEVKQHLVSALDSLSRDEDCVSSKLSRTISEVEKLGTYIADYRDIADRLEAVNIEISDIIRSLEVNDNNFYDSGKSLEEIERRLGEIYSLEARHNVASDTQLINIREELKRKVSNTEVGDEILSELEIKAKTAKKNAVLAARKLTESRTKTAAIFSEDLRSIVRPLGLNNLRCEIIVTPEKLGEWGMDSVQFLFSFNKNQSLMPVGKTASGGEISRVVLGVKSLLAEKMNLPTIIFDEVDTGVSGDIANKMADLMLQISKKTQVIAITHIATVAAHGEKHFKVYKKDAESATNTYVKELSRDERLAELATMISGKGDDEASLETAKSLLDKK